VQVTPYSDSSPKIRFSMRPQSTVPPYMELTIVE